MKNTAEQITYSAMASQMPAPKRGWNVRATNGGADLGYILPNGVSEKTARQLAADLTSGRKTCVQQQVDGELQEVTAGRGRRDFSRIPMDRRREMYLRWVSEGIEKGWNPSGAWMRYYAMFKEPPEAEWMLESSAEMRPIIAARDRKPGELMPA